MKLRLIATTALTGALVLASTAAATGRVAQIYFYANTFDAIGSPYSTNHLTVHPGSLLMAPDGHWVIVNIRWTGWGTPSAQASGISDASDCSPSCAGGRHKRSPATIVLSRPIRLLGHTVYSCFKLTIARVPAANQSLCIKRATTGPGYLYTPSAASTPSRPAGATDARFYTPSRNISCEIFDPGTSASHGGVGCLMIEPQATVNLGVDGQATICQHQAKDRCTGNFGEGPKFRPLPYGRSVTAGRFRCTSATDGVTCVLRSTGKGFFISAQSVRLVG